MKIIFFLLFFLNHIAMAQKIEFNEKGLNIVSIGSRIDSVKGLDVKPIKNHPKFKEISIWFEDEYDYFFVDSDKLNLNDSGTISSLFFASNKSSEIAGIFLFIKNKEFNIVELLNAVFSDAKLNSESFIGSLNTNSKIFWKKNDISVFLTRAQELDIYKIALSNTGIDEHTPGINLHFR